MPFVTSDGVRIHYEVEGTGPSILFHTGAGGDGAIWGMAGYVAGLPGFRKILLDHRGRGQSERPDDVEAHRMERFVADIASVLDAQAVRSCGFWGYSAGILAGLAFGAAYPERVACLVGTGALPHENLCDLPPLDPETWIREDVAQGGVAREVNAYGKRGEFFPEAIDRNVRAGDPVMHALDRLGRRKWKGPLALYPEFRTPTLIFAGEQEDEEHETERSVDLLPRGRLVRLPGVGHLGAFYRSVLVLPLALPFLREHLR